MSDKVLFVTHKKSRCGVYEFGANVFSAIKSSKRYDFVFSECADVQEYRQAVETDRPAVVLYNFHPSTMGWLTRTVMRPQNGKHVALIHEFDQASVDRLDNRLFDFFIAADPTLLLKNPIVFKTGRLIRPYKGDTSPPQVVPVIGSFGFATPGKGFDKLVRTVQEQFDRAVVRLNLPAATFGDEDGQRARALAAQCQQTITKAGITLEVSHDYLEPAALMKFLASNSLNAFLYEDQKGRGISSVVDHALAVDRPLAISASSMFRHLHDVTPSIVVDPSTLPEILARGTAGLLARKHAWTAENLVWDYERILSAVLKADTSRGHNGWLANKLSEVAASETMAPARRAMAVALRGAGTALAAAQRNPVAAPLAEQAKKAAKNFAPIRRLAEAVAAGGARTSAASADWVPQQVDTPLSAIQSTTRSHYTPSAHPHGGFNRILNDDARRFYAPTIDFLFSVAPALMARKIKEANVQQAFVFDSVVRLVAGKTRPRLLCVGSYEDTAAAGVVATGLDVEEVDPVLNYDLSTYLTKPDTKLASFDAVFSTSVIEHVVDDATFLREIESLLAPGGVGVLTCDFNDNYRPGDPLPAEDRRFYTVKDFKQRMLPLLSSSDLVDEPNWEWPGPDFTYGVHRYSFASFVFRKRA